ncbi:DUF6262 family protein [Streptomyces sp. NPDC050433]|uniref:DUF6262 family protein n=1 Tax=unclassified Streptomyces TaxID=2593676 RepID=UPI0034134F3D
MNKRPNDAVPETMPPAGRRIAALRQAAQDKHQQAVQRAEAGIRRLVKEGEEINFRAVARAAGVSLGFLYAHTDLRKRIETLRGQQRTENQSPPQAPSADDGTVIHALTEALRRERATTESASKSSNNDWPRHTARSRACNA